MSKLAIYDKHYGEHDKKIDEYYRHDYVYRKNVVVRIFAFIGCAIALMFYWLYQIFVLGVDILALDYQSILLQMIVFVGAVMICYTIIGTIKYNAEYSKGRSRLKKYYFLLTKLEKLKVQQKTEEENDFGESITN